MNKQSLLIVILSLLLGLGLGYFIFHKSPTPIPDPEIKIIENREKIDSLEKVIDGKNQRIDFLLDSASKIKNVVVRVEVEKINELPMSENLDLLKENLVKHGELTQSSDTLPKLMSIPDRKDTLAVLSENNIKDVNGIVAKYEGEIKINNTLSEVIENQSSIISDKDSILVRKDIILNETELKYMQDVEKLNRSLKIKNTEIIIGGAVLGSLAVVFGILAATKK